MSKKYKPNKKVYAIVRVDEHEHVPDEIRITVKEIVCDIELAKVEVERLNQINSHKQCKYFWQMTRLYPEGVSAGTNWSTLNQ